MIVEQQDNVAAFAGGLTMYWVLQPLVQSSIGVTPPVGADVFLENRHAIELGMKPITAAGMGGVLIE